MSVAAELKVCTATVYKLVDRGELPHVRVLNSIRDGELIWRYGFSSGHSAR